MLRLIKFDKSCYGALISWVETAGDLMQFAGPAFIFPLTEEQLDNSLSDANRYAFKVINADDGSTIGHAEIYLAGDSAYLGRILIGSLANRGKGHGQKMVSLLLQHAFDDLRQTCVRLNVFEKNSAAIRCYKKVGFEIDPEMKFERIVNGQVWKGFTMSIGRKRWEGLRLSQ